MSHGQADLHTSVRDAQLLLEHASLRGIELPDELVSEIVQAKSLLRGDESDPATFDQQRVFWISLRRLAQAVAPASIDTIRYTKAEVASPSAKLWGKLTGAATGLVTVGEAAVRRAGWIALAWLIVVGVCQWYVEVASTTLQLYATNKSIYERSKRQALQLDEDSKKTESEILLLVEIERVQRETERQLLVMERLLLFADFPANLAPADRAKQVLAATEFYLIVLRGFLLPALWGLIGAALYVLRTLAQQLGDTSYSRDHATLHRSRYYLGAVSGFVVAKFSLALSGKVLDDTIQPFVLALLVGYSVDVLFNLLAKLIEAFSPKPTSGP